MTFRVFPSGAGLGKNLSPSAGRGHETAADLIGVRPVGPVRERPPGARAAARVSCPGAVPPRARPEGGVSREGAQAQRLREPQLVQDALRVPERVQHAEHVRPPLIVQADQERADVRQLHARRQRAPRGGFEIRRPQIRRPEHEPGREDQGEKTVQFLPREPDALLSRPSRVAILRVSRYLASPLDGEAFGEAGVGVEVLEHAPQQGGGAVTERTTTPYMTKYERARILGTRALQISMNAPVLVQLDGETDPLEIAGKELREKRIPFTVRRYLPDGSWEDWGVDELIVYKEAPGTSYEDYTSVDLVPKVMEITGGEGVKAVIDGIGLATWETSIEVLARRGIFVSFGNASGAVPAFPPLRFINKSGFLTRPKLNDYTVTREELMSRANDIYGWLAKGEMTVTVSTSHSREYFPPSIPRPLSPRRLVADEINIGCNRGHTCANNQYIKQSFEATRRRRRLLNALSRPALAPTEPDLATPRVSPGRPLLPPRAGQGGPRLPGGR